MGLDSYLTSKCVALILRNGKRLIRAQQFIHFIAQKQTAGNRQSSFTDHVGVAHQSAERPKPADIDLAFKPMNGRFTERGRKANAGIQQQTVVSEVFKCSPIPVPLGPKVTR